MNNFFTKNNVLPTIFFSMLMILASSCFNENYLGGHSTEEGCGTQVVLKASIDSELKPDAIISPNELISVSTGYEDNTSLNRMYVCNQDGESYVQKNGYPIYVKATTCLLGYYPFQGIEGSDPELSLNTCNQTSVEDLFIARSKEISPADEAVVNLSLVYAYAQLQMNLILPEGETVSSFRLSGVHHEGRMKAFSHDIEFGEITTDIKGDVNGTQLILTLIPQQITKEDKAEIAFVGKKRSYLVALDSFVLESDKCLVANIDLRNGMGTVEFVSEGGQWNDSNIGGNIDAQ